MYFISHAWSNSIELLFRKVFDFLASADDGTRVWLDVLAVCQHESNPAHRTDIAAFADVVAACSGGTLVVMDLTRCNPATRAWCVFEWAHTLAAHGPDGLHMALAPLERAAVFADLDVERAECFRPADKEMIMTEVRRQHGSPEAFNAKLKLQLLLEPLSYSVDLRRLQERSRDTAWEFVEVERWLEAMYGSSGTRTDGGSRLLCVVSGAGEGKSTISAELVRRLTPATSGVGAFTASSQITCAYHFLKYNDQRRLDPVRIIKTIAFQLASRIPSVYSALLDLDVAGVAQITDVDRAFELLLMRPLEGVTTPVVVLLDALDEAEPVPFAIPTGGGGADAPNGGGGGGGGGVPVPKSPTADSFPVICGNGALQLLTKHLQRLPPAIRFFVTTRPDAASGQVVPSLERAFHHQGGSTYVKPSQLVKMAKPRTGGRGGGGGGGGVMVYQTVVKDCLLEGKEDEVDKETAAEGDESSRPSPSGPKTTATAAGAAADLTALYRVYGEVFRKSYEQYDTKKRTDVSKLLNVLLAAQEPLSQSLVQQLGLGHAVPLLPGFPVLFFVDEHHLFTLHKSLADWLLLDAWRSSASGSGSGSLEQTTQASHKNITASDPSRGSSSRSFFSRTAPKAVAGGGGGGGFFLFSRSAGGVASRAALDSEAARTAAVAAAAAAAVNAPSPLFHMDIAQGHQILGRYLSTTRTTSPSTYCLKYLVTHLAAAGPAAGELLDDVLTSFRFIEVVFARGYSGNVIRALGAMGHYTRLSRDALRWLRTKQHDLLVAASGAGEAGTGDTVVGTALMSPLRSELYHVALKAANQCWRTRFAVPSYDEWPADQAVLKGHTGNITAVLFSRDGHQLVSSSGGGYELRVWDIGTGTCTAVLLGHEADVTCLAMSRGGHVIASGSNDMTCRLWDAATGQCTAVLCGHTAPVTGVAFSPPERGQPQRLITSSSDNTMRIWAPAPKSSSGGGGGGSGGGGGGQRGRRSSTGYDAAAASPRQRGRDVRHSNAELEMDIAMGLTVRGSGGGYDMSYDVNVGGVSHTCVQVLQGRDGGLQGVAWAPDGRGLAGAHGADVCLWALPGGKVAATLTGHDANILAVAFSPNDGGRRLASGGWDKVIRLWDTRTKKCIAKAAGHSELVRALSWSPDGRRLASASSDNTLRIWDMAPTLAGGGGAATAMSVQCTAIVRQGEWLTAVSFSPDGRSLASGSVAKELRLWDVAACEAEFAAACKAAKAAAAAGDGAIGTPGKITQKSSKTLNSTDGGEAAAAAAAAATHAVAHTGDVTCVALSPDGTLLATASQDRTVRLYDSDSAQWLATLAGHDGCVTCVAWAPLPPTPPSTSTSTSLLPRLASVSHDLTIRIWDVDLGGGDAAVKATCSETLPGHTDRIRSVAWSPAGDGHLATGAEDNHVCLWKISRGGGGGGGGKCLATLWGHGNYVTCVAYCPADGGRTLTSASEDGTIRVWDTATCQTVRTLRGHDHYVNHVSYTPCGALLASAACDQTVRLWEHATGKCVAVLSGHTHFVNYVAFEPPPPTPGKATNPRKASAALPRRLASASTDSTVRLWDLRTRQCRGVLQGHAGPVYCVTWIRGQAATTGPPPTAATGGGGKGAADSEGGSEGGGGGVTKTPTRTPTTPTTTSTVTLPAELASGSADHSVRLWREGSG
ncbi:hypothetical protein Vafri_17234 [Volvox africanus]|nr:hypothetical protein Vafri_17234 [Volvox africanus]